jgi:hypothetical protein
MRKASSLNESTIANIEEKHKQEIQKLGEKHTLALVKKYGEALIEARGLKLPTKLQTLFGACKTEAEVRQFLRESVELMREGMNRPVKPLTEIKVEGEQVESTQSKLNSAVSTAFSGMGYKAIK